MPEGQMPPAEITAGDTVSFVWTSGGYPASGGWAMTWRVVGAGVGVTLAAVAAGEGFTITAAGNAFAGLTIPARGIPCMLFGAATRAGERVTLYRAPLLLLPDPATAAVDLRGHAAAMLEAIEALLEGRATSDQMSYRIGDRELSRIPIPDLTALRDYYQGAARREDDAAARRLGRPGRPRRVVMQMGRA